MSDYESWFDWILTAQDVQVGATNRGQGYPDDCVVYSRLRTINFFNPNIVFAVKDVGHHLCHHTAFFPWSPDRVARALSNNRRAHKNSVARIASPRGITNT